MSESKTYLYQQIYNELKAQILDEHYPAHSFLPSERELCDRFGAWRATVRQALDKLSSDGLIEKKVGVGAYVLPHNPNKDPLDTSSRPQTKEIIGFFTTDADSKDMRLTQPYYYDLMLYLERFCHKKNFMLLYSSVSTAEDMRNIIHNNTLSLAVFLSHSNFSCVDTASAQGIPCALVNEQYQDYTVVSCDHMMTGHLAINYLYKCGHHNIGIIAGPPSYMSTRDKIAGCLRACNELNIPFPNKNHLMYGNWEYEGGYACAKKMFSHREASIPSALFVFNDSMCLGAMHAIRELGYSIPQDISVISSDNMTQTMCSEPNLTTIDTGIEHTAQMIVELAANKFIPHLSKGVKLLTPVSLEIRNSVRDIRDSR